ncbi:MAG: tetratricopeptide repeat protein [Leptospirillum sp.]
MGLPRLDLILSRGFWAMFLVFLLVGQVGCSKNRAERMYDQGMVALEHLDLARAREDFTGAIAKSPVARTRGKAYFRLGRMDDLYQNDPGQASQDYMKALENLQGGVIRQKVSFFLARDLDRLSRSDQALEILEKIDADSLDSEFQGRIYLLMARIYEHRENYRDASVFYKKVVHAVPDGFTGEKARYKLGLMDAFLGNSSGASVRLTAFLKRYPDSTFASVARLNLASIDEKDGQYQKALELLTALISSYPNPALINSRIMELRKKMDNHPVGGQQTGGPPGSGASG